MLDGIFGFAQGLATFMKPVPIALALLSSLVGFVIGALPGLTATMAIAAHHPHALPASVACPADPDLCLCRRHLRRQPQRHPAELPYPGVRRLLDGPALARQG